jgi:hypothetical protein
MQRAVFSLAVEGRTASRCGTARWFDDDHLGAKVRQNCAGIFAALICEVDDPGA